MQTETGIPEPRSSIGSGNRITIPVKKCSACLLAALACLLFCCTGTAQTDPESLFKAGVRKYKEGEFQAAVDLFSELIILVPDSGKALKNRGVALMNLGKIDEAISDFSKAIEIAPTTKDIYVNLGAAWHYKGAYEKAVKAYDRAVKEDPPRALTYYNRGISKMFLKDLAGAVTDFDKALALDSELDASIYARQEAQKKLAEISGATYSVQAGAFRVKENAEAYRKKLAEKGIDGRLVLFKDTDKRTWYIIRCGRGLSREEANRLQAELSNRHGIEACVRPEHSL